MWSQSRIEGGWHDFFIFTLPAFIKLFWGTTNSICRFGKWWVPCGPSLVFFVYTGLLVWTYPQSHRLNVTYCSISSLLLGFWFLFVCMADQTQMCCTSISTLGLFQEIIFNIGRWGGAERKNLGALNHWGDLNWNKGPQISLHTILDA